MGEKEAQIYNPVSVLEWGAKPIQAWQKQTPLRNKMKDQNKTPWKHIDSGIKTEEKKMGTTGRSLKRGQTVTTEIGGAFVPWGEIKNEEGNWRSVNPRREMEKTRA